MITAGKAYLKALHGKLALLSYPRFRRNAAEPLKLDPLFNYLFDGQICRGVSKLRFRDLA